MVASEEERLFLSVSSVTDAARTDTERKIQERADELLRDDDIKKAISKRLETIARERLELRDKVYRILCKHFADFDHESKETEEVRNYVKSKVRTEVVQKDVEGQLPSGLREGIGKLRNFLLENLEHDPYEIIKDTRKQTRKGMTETIDLLEERIETPDVSPFPSVQQSLDAKTDLELVGKTCADAAGWWNPRSPPIKVAVGPNSELLQHRATIQQVIHEKMNGPNEIELALIAQAKKPVSS